jgi:general transcription factor 3C polypeptide 1
VTRGKQKTTRLRPRKKSSMPVVMNWMTSEEMVQRSLGVANAVELVKLVLLNASESTDVPLSMVNALRRCEESHVFAAFNFLRNRELVVCVIAIQFFIYCFMNSEVIYPYVC